MTFFFFAFFHHLAGQSLRNEIDSLLKVALQHQFDGFFISDSIYQHATEKIISVGIESEPELWVRVHQHRAMHSIFHNKLRSAKEILSSSFFAIDEYKHLLKSKCDSLRAHLSTIEASYLCELGDYSNALIKLNTAEIFFRHQQLSAAICQTLYQILQFQASIFHLQGELSSCIDRYLGSIRYYDCYRQPGKFPNYILAHRNIGLAYLRMGDREKTRYHFFLAKANLDSCPIVSRDFVIRFHAQFLYTSIADFYLADQQFDSAEYYFKNALAITGNSFDASGVTEGIGRLALARKNYQLAIDILTKSLKTNIEQHGQKSYITANTYRSISSVYGQTGNFIMALMHIQKALNSLSPTGAIPINDYTQNPSLALSYMPKEMMMTLNQKAALLTSQHNKKGNREFLLAARTTNNLALQVLDSTRNEFSLEKDKVVLGEDAVKVYQTGLNIASLLYRETNDPRYLTECFGLIDKSKSTVLMDHIKLVKSFGGIPSDLIDRERELKVELSVAEQQLYTAEIKKEETSIHRQHLGEIKKAYAALLNDIKISAPNYYKLRIENKQPTLPEAQRMLKPGELLVEYFFSDSMLYTMTITRTTAELHTAAIDSLRSQVETLRNMLARPGNLADANYQGKWNSICKAVFKKVVAPWQKHLKSSKRIIVVPHDVLNYLPLEMLSDPGTPLINSVSISYASSAALLREQKQMTPTGNFFAAFDADYSNQPHLPQLAGASREVSSIENIFGFRSTRFAAATADDFRKQAANFKIIHLALHSLINDEKPMFSRLVFTRTADDNTNDDITANELYSMQLNAEIAVLSACETGLGKLQRGEGMMSLSRAFMYAGVPSTVISLWKVPDQSASILMTKFYQFLKEGHRKDEALQLAKLEFIKEHPEMSHPFFWAGFIVNGKTDPLSFAYFSTQEIFAIAILGLCLALASTMFILNRRRGAKPISVTH